MRLLVVTFGVLALWPGVAQAAQKENPMSPAIESGSKVQIEYTLKDDAGSVFDSNKGGEALTYTQGQQELIPGLEKALQGMRAGEEKKVTVKPEEGYGPVDPRAQLEVPKEAIPAGALKVGTTLQGRSQSGQPMRARVKEIKEKSAGKTLHFDVKVLGVGPPQR